MSKPWDGRFREKTLSIVDRFNASISFDKELYREDIEGSIAHCRMLVKQGIISEEEGEKIVKGLNQILKEIEEGKFQFKEELEDIHMNIEARLIEIIGDVGGKLHTARSRNDQVALDIRMWTKKKIEKITALLKDFLEAIVEVSEREIDTFMPGFTHLQIAQPVLLSHHFLSYFEMFKRDFLRFRDCFKRMDECPLGAGALAGTTFNIDRFFTAEILGFSKPTDNSMDSVADRDFLIEFISNCAITMMHLSRLAEEIILWSSQVFNFVELPDSMSTGSSIMPQKKNPDVAELVRGKTGRVYGNLMSILTVMKSLPLTYNKDLQEDKEPVFDTAYTLINSVEIMTALIKKLKFKRDVLKFWASKGFSGATDVADYLADKGVPFREAHRISGKIVAYCLDKGKELEDMTFEEFKKFSDKFEEDIVNVVKIENVVNRRDSYGGTSKTQVLFQIKKAKEFLESCR